jgi:hypothetical protein
MELYLKVIGCSCYTYLPQSSPAAAQIGLSKGLLVLVQKLSVYSRAQRQNMVQHIHIHANKTKDKKQYIIT